MRGDQLLDALVVIDDGAEVATVVRGLRARLAERAVASAAGTVG